MKSVFSNQNVFEKLLTFLALAPFVRQFIPQAESSGEPGPAKRAFVVASTVAAVAPLIAAGWFPPDVADEKQVGKFIDTFIREDNANGGVATAAPITLAPPAADEGGGPPKRRTARKKRGNK